MKTDDTQTPDRFEERLLAAMLEDFDSLTAPPTRRLRLARPPRRRLAWAGGIAATAALAALAVAITGGGSGASGPVTGAGNATASLKAAGGPSSSHFVNADYVVRRVERATGDGNGGLIEYVSSHAPDSETGRPTWTESWTLPGSPTSRIQTLDPEGHPLTAAILTVGDEANESVLVDYVDRTWAKLVSPNHPHGAEPAPARSPGSSGNWEAELHQELASGEFRIAGQEAIEGREAIELEATDPYPGGLLRLWVDAETFRPIREIGAAPGVAADSPQAIRNEYRWLPANAENLALLDPDTAAPAGFEEVPLATEEQLEAGD